MQTSTSYSVISVPGPFRLTERYFTEHNMKTKSVLFFIVHFLFDQILVSQMDRI